MLVIPPGALQPTSEVILHSALHRIQTQSIFEGRHVKLHETDQDRHRNGMGNLINFKMKTPYIAS